MRRIRLRLRAKDDASRADVVDGAKGHLTAGAMLPGMQGHDPVTKSRREVVRQSTPRLQAEDSRWQAQLGAFH
uniref:Uncharacterized protein n=1 Tax=Arundo donax TaxID=35708 RepID=A0A0A9CHI2_ARUDO